MPVPIKFTSMFQSDAGWGWSETHYKLSSGDNPDLKIQIDNFIANVVPKRIELLGMDCAFVGCRASYPRAGVIAAQGRRQYFRSPLTNQPGAAFSESLAVNFVDATNTRKKICHLRGFWDNVILDSTYQPTRPEALGWTERFVQWKEQLKNGYGWLSKDPALSGSAAITNYVSSAENIVTFALGGGGIPTAPIGVPVMVSVSRLNGSKSVLNRSLLVQFITPTSCFTVKPIAAGAFVGEGQMNYRATSFVGYADTTSISAGRRSMGRPLNRPLGKSKAKATT